jgi:serine/threonine-protein kinase
MDCPEQETIERYILGRLEASEFAELEVHLETCGHCKTKLAQARENENLLSELRFLGTNTSSRGDSVTTQRVHIGTVERAQELLGSKYRVIRMVGRGGAGEVFQTIDPILDRQVAIKFLTRKDTAEEISKQRWQEARLLGQLNHPNVAQVYGIGESEGGVRYIVMEWVEGLLLTDAWREMGLQQRLGLYLQVLDGISAAHRRGIIHRDIKPSNILVTAANKAKVLDFGIAVDEQPLMSADEDRYRGTPAFSEPEQITAPVKVSPATDVFALGILLYDLLNDT